MGFPGGSAIKNPPANAGGAGSTPGSGRFPGEGNGNHSSILAWEMSWTEELGGLLCPWGRKVGHDLVTKATTIFHCTYVPHLLYPFTYRWALRVFLYLGYCK